MKKVRMLGAIGVAGALPALGALPQHAPAMPAAKTSTKTVSLQARATCGATHEVSVAGNGKDPAFQYWVRAAGSTHCIGTVKARGFGPAGAPALADPDIWRSC